MGVVEVIVFLQAAERCIWRPRDAVGVEKGIAMVSLLVASRIYRFPAPANGGAEAIEGLGVVLRTLLVLIRHI
jgi:hypothetical protein